MVKLFNLPNRINKKKDNILNFHFPLNILSRGEDAGNSQNNNISIHGKRPMVIFIGNDYRNLPGTDLEQAIRLTDKCLDYVRRECHDCDLFYKPHPTETDEYEMLNLDGFKMMGKMPVELLYMKYVDSISHVFSVCSSASRTAYEFGFNSYVLLDVVASALDKRAVIGFWTYLSGLPKECFINDLTQSLRDNKKNSQEDTGILSENIKNLLKNQNRTVWMLVGDANNIPRIKVIEKLVKKHSPGTIFHLVPTQHHRWSNVPIDEIKKIFDAVSFVPRVFYSMRPRTILNAWRAARLIRRWPVGKDDVIITSLGLSFSDNCFVSYFPHVPRIALVPKDFFDLACKEQTVSAELYRRRPGAIFFNRILEPILGVEHTEYLESKSGWHIYRYAKPLNDVFDQVWVY